MERQQTKSSLESYQSDENKKGRLTQKELIRSVFDTTNDKYTIREMKEACGLSYNATQKRMSDLLSDGYIIVYGQKIENKNNNSIFSINRNPQFFKVKKKTNFELLDIAISNILVEDLRDEILKEYTRLKEKN